MSPAPVPAPRRVSDTRVQGTTGQSNGRVRSTTGRGGADVRFRRQREDAGRKRESVRRRQCRWRRQRWWRWCQCRRRWRTEIAGDSTQHIPLIPAKAGVSGFLHSPVNILRLFPRRRILRARQNTPLMPAQAGHPGLRSLTLLPWTPAFAGASGCCGSACAQFFTNVLDFIPIRILFYSSGSIEGRHHEASDDGAGCGVRGRETNAPPTHSGGAGAPPGGQYGPPARSWLTVQPWLSRILPERPPE